MASYLWIKKDKRYLAYRRYMETENLAPAFQEELENIHMARKSRYLRADSGLKVKNIIQASMHDNIARSRCIEIYNAVFKESYLLKDFLNTLSDYIMAHYSSNLGTTKYEKDSAISDILSKGWSRLTNLEIACKTADKIIDDIDKTSWSYKSVLAGLEIATKGEVSL